MSPRGPTPGRLSSLILDAVDGRSDDELVSVSLYAGEWRAISVYLDRIGRLAHEQEQRGRGVLRRLL